LVQFRCLTKLGAKRREVVQKFGPWSRVRIFHNKPLDPPHWTLTIRSTPLGALRTIWVHLGEFGCITTLSAKWANLVQKFMPRSRVGIFRNERTRSTTLASKLTFWCVFILFGCIWDRLVAVQNSVPNWPKWCKSSCHEGVSEFFAMNAPNPPHWTQNSCFIAFHTILVHLGLFGCVTKHSVKRAKLMQKFVPQSGVGFFS